MSQSESISPSKLLVVFTTLPSEEAAKAMVHILMEQNLAACVQLMKGVQSIYRWEGRLCDEQEILLSAKTLASKWPEILSVIQENHPYELPEILAFSPEQYSQQYGDWIKTEINKA
jgi:periplasmic divalent cation tolerance protein